MEEENFPRRRQCGSFASLSLSDGGGEDLVSDTSAPSGFVPLIKDDISTMPDCPLRQHSVHRRAQSDIPSLPDDICFDVDLGSVRFEEGPSISDDVEDDFFFSDAADRFLPRDLMGNVGSTEEPFSLGGEFCDAKPRVRHQHSQSMDSSIHREVLAGDAGRRPPSDAKKAISDAKLAELSLVDPKRAKRILANRQSAARSKERKMRYIAELERKLQAFQAEATAMSVQLSLMQRDTTRLTSENSELKLQLQTSEQQLHMQDAINERFKEELHRLRAATGQMVDNGGKVSYTQISSLAVNAPPYQRNDIHVAFLSQQLQKLNVPSSSQKHKQQSTHATHQQNQTDEGSPSTIWTSSPDGRTSNGS